MRVGIIAVGQSRFGELWEKSLRQIAVDAGDAVFADLDKQTSGQLSKKDVQSLFIGNMASGSFTNQSNIGSLLSDYLGISGVSAVRLEGACASGSLAFRSAYHSIKAGENDVSMVLGVEKMTDVSPEKTQSILMHGGDFESEALSGLTFTGLYALMTRRHMKEFGTTRRQLSAVSYTNHKNGVKNLFAQFPKEIRLEDVENSTMIADPLTVLDCSPITDGSAAVIIASEDYIKKHKIENPVWIKASSCATDRLGFFQRKSHTELNATKLAMKKIVEKDGVSVKSLDFSEVHDCFTINEIVALEDIGIVEKGFGGKFAENNEIGLNGSFPTNTTGGLKSIGHPIGATGVRQIGDITKQLRGDSINQLKSAKRGIAVNIGGVGATTVIHVLDKE